MAHVIAIVLSILVTLTAFVVVGRVFLKNLLLSELPPIAGETILAELDGVRVDFVASHVSMSRQFPGCRVRVTDQRIVFAQPGVGGAEPLVRGLIHVRAEPGAHVPGRTWGVFTPRGAMRVERDGAAPSVGLPVAAQPGAFGQVHEVVIHTDDPAPFERSLARP